MVKGKNKIIWKPYRNSVKEWGTKEESRGGEEEANRVQAYRRRGRENQINHQRREMGVEKQVVRPGTGPKPLPGQNVTVHCTGFGSSRHSLFPFLNPKYDTFVPRFANN